MEAQMSGKKIINGLNSTVDFIVLSIIILLLAIAGYALWDSEQIYQAADKSLYAIYKPTVDGGKSFKELQAINPEVFAWLTVYGTNIDYPVAQSQDNMKYVNTNAEGLYSFSGSIFLDCGNSKDFSDFNSIIYGHHMEKKKMFGDIGLFSDLNMFHAHRYGNLYYDGKDHGIEFFAFIHTDAYDRTVFSPNVTGKEAQQNYLDGLLAKAMYQRDIGVTIKDNIVLLATCSSSTTNGRDLLVGKITNKAYSDPFNVEEDSNTEDGLVIKVLLWPLLLILLLLIRLGVKSFLIYRGRKRSNDQG